MHTAYYNIHVQAQDWLSTEVYPYLQAHSHYISRLSSYCWIVPTIQSEYEHLVQIPKVYWTGTLSIYRIYEARVSRSIVNVCFGWERAESSIVLTGIYHILSEVHMIHIFKNLRCIRITWYQMYKPDSSMNKTQTHPAHRMTFVPLNACAKG